MLWHTRARVKYIYYFHSGVLYWHFPFFFFVLIHYYFIFFWYIFMFSVLCTVFSLEKQGRILCWKIHMKYFTHINSDILWKLQVVLCNSNNNNNNHNTIVSFFGFVCYFIILQIHSDIIFFTFFSRKTYDQNWFKEPKIRRKTICCCNWVDKEKKCFPSNKERTNERKKK